ncbi:hypothetical protein [Roseinatronobacter sp.]|uniref:hypothetical protein n=1 Tax=Roseinatronobacter sp. TaxID=1945755 RepID=UPI0025EE3165|nr:hypothetical protein [Roseibaca sp.]
MSKVPFHIVGNIPEDRVSELEQDDLILIPGDFVEFLELYRAMADLADDVELNCGARGNAACKAVSQMIARGCIVTRQPSYDARESVAPDGKMRYDTV